MSCRNHIVSDDMLQMRARQCAPSADRQEVEALCNALRRNTTLLELRAGGRRLDVAGAAAFSRLLAANHTLRLLCIGGADFGDEAAVVLAEGLAQNIDLQELDLAGPRGIGPRGAEALAEALLQQQHRRQPTAQRSHVGGQSKRSQGAEADSSGLRVLDLSQNPIGDGGGAALAVCASGLEHLTLTACGLGCEAAAALGRAASCDGSSLCEVDLSLNPLGPAGGEKLAAGLTANGHAVLASLALADTQLNDAGAAAVLAASAALPSLRHLDLSRCGLQGDAELQSLARLPINSLTSLVLSGNDLSSASISAFMDIGMNLLILDLSGEASGPA